MGKTIISLQEKRIKELRQKYDLEGDGGLSLKIKTLGPFDSFMGIRPGEWLDEADENGMPPCSPAIPLGYNGNIFYVQTNRGTIEEFTAAGWQRGHVESLYGGTCYPEWAWPKTKWDRKLKTEVPTGEYHSDRVRKTIIRACEEAGAFDPADRVRGRGAWLDESGQIIFNLGTKLVTAGGEINTGFYGEYFYARAPALDTPEAYDANEPELAASYVLELLQGWSWPRVCNPMLLLGWMGTALICGLLERRPTVYVTGDRGTGKSTLLSMVARVLGRGTFVSSDTTAAGLSQAMGYDALPAIVDEMEAKNDNRRAEGLVEFARISYDGASRHRGGSSHRGQMFTAHSSILFASINKVPMTPADRSRMAVLEMNRLPEGSVEPEFDNVELNRCGRAMLRRLMDWWMLEDKSGFGKSYFISSARACHKKFMLRLV